MAQVLSPLKKHAKFKRSSEKLAENVELLLQTSGLCGGDPMEGRVIRNTTALLRSTSVASISEKITLSESRGEKAILGATLEILGHSWSNFWNCTHGLIFVRTLFSEQLSERLPELVGRQP